MENSKIVKNFIDKWHENKISYCHWKSIDHLKEAYDGTTDLDILVDFTNMNLAEQLVLGGGFIDRNKKFKFLAYSMFTRGN